MPVQINEIVIRVNVDESRDNAVPSHTGGDTLQSDNNCNCSGESMAEKILQIIREKNER